jgi:hypothetical protein
MSFPASGSTSGGVGKYLGGAHGQRCVGGKAETAKPVHNLVYRNQPFSVKARTLVLQIVPGMRRK